MAIRQPTITIVIATTGAGKTYQTMQEIYSYIKTIGDQEGRSVLVIDLKNEYRKFGVKAIAYNPREENTLKRVKNISKIKTLKKPAIYRILAKHPNGIPFSEDDMQQTLSDVYTYLKTGLVLLEDMGGIYPDMKLPKDFINILTSMRHENMDLIMHVQDLGMPPPGLLKKAKFIRLHKTVDSVLTLSSSKYKNIEELVRIAELIINKKYRKAPMGIDVKEMKRKIDIYNRTYFCYIDLVNHKLSRVTEKDFEEACETYLQQTPKAYRHLLNMEDENGNKLYKTKAEARKAMIKEKKLDYL